jgi:PKD repeat protein
MFVPVGISVDNGNDGVITIDEEINFSAPPASDQATFLWDFDDGSGSTSTEKNPTYGYADTGTYNILLEVTEPDLRATQGTTTYNMTITVLELEPASANFTHDEMVATEASVVFTNTSTGGGTLNYMWDFGDGTSSTDEEPTNSYSEAGSYDVSLTTSNDLSNDTMSSSITVIDAVVASFTHNAPVVEGNEISFTNNSTGGGTMTYMWDFDDGKSSDQANPSHTYTTTGSYNVSLTVSNEVSTETSSQSVEIIESPTAVTLNHLSTQPNEQSMLLLWGLASLLAMGIALTRIRAMHLKQ